MIAAIPARAGIDPENRSAVERMGFGLRQDDADSSLTILPLAPVVAKAASSISGRC
jgi:hypothetical protein